MVHPVKKLFGIDAEKKIDSCQGCNVEGHSVFEIKLRTSLIRLCPDCFNKMVQKVNALK